MSTRAARLLIGVAILSAATGCTSVRYAVTNRVLDLTDMVRLNVGAGRWAGAHVKVTSYLQGGVLFFEGNRYGLLGRKAGSWEEGRMDLHIALPLFHKHTIRPTDWSAFDKEESGRQTVWVFDPDFSEAPYAVYRPAEVMACIHLFWGIEAGFDIVEVFDFLVGFFGFDPCGDALEPPGGAPLHPPGYGPPGYP